MNFEVHTVTANVTHPMTVVTALLFCGVTVGTLRADDLSSDGSDVFMSTLDNSKGEGKVSECP